MSNPVSPRRRGVVRFLLVFLPSLVFIIALTAPAGDYVFRAGPLGEVGPGEMPPYVLFAGGTLYLYSSPYGTWHYPRAVAVDLFYPTTVYVSSTCGAAGGVLGGAVGRHYVDLYIPPGFEGVCLLNFTAAGGWWRVVTLRVKVVDWYPGAVERAVVRLNGSGWQFVQVGRDGVFYIWERPVAKLPAVGCVFVYNGSVLMAEGMYYRAIQRDLLPPSFLPSGEGVVRHGAFLYLNGVGTLHVYSLPCLPAVGAAVREPPPLVGRFGVVKPDVRAAFFDGAVVNNTVFFHTALRVVNLTVAVGDMFQLYLYTYSTPVGMWGAVLRYNFKPNTLLTTEVSFFKPQEAVGPLRAGDMWLYNASGVYYWVYGGTPYYTCSPPCGIPTGWTEPLYVVVDPDGRWGGWPQVLAVGREALRPWGP
ncbi:MAG: hypothetical protein ACK4SY_09845 [Pyrobaculum sp.]